MNNSKLHVALLLVLCFLSFTNVAQAQSNILFIAIDDMKPLLGCYGDEMAITPNIDRLADSGVTFLNAHCQFSVCGPSRASLTSSLMPEETGVTGFKALRYKLPDLITLPQHFKNNGYETAAIGKIHDFRTVGDLNPANPSGQTINGSVADDVLSWSIPYDKGGSGIGSTSATSVDDASKSLKMISESVNAADSAFVDGSICDKGLTQLNSLASQYKTTGKPFFLGVGFKKPHMPFLAPKKYFDYYQRDDFKVHPYQWDPLNVLPNTFNSIQEMRGNYYLHLDSQGKAITIPQIIPEDDQKEIIHGYYACASFIDFQIGRLIDELESLGIADDTIIVLWGDHGFHLGDHNEWGKHTNMEQATRSPLMICVPDLAGNGRKTMTPASFLDIYPTLCDLTGLTVPEQPLSDTQLTGRPLAGKSLVPILHQTDDSVRFGTTIHYGGGTYGYAYRTERYRYVEWIDGSKNIAGYELYDYKFDPYETVNLAPNPEYAVLVQQLSNSMRAAGESAGCERLKATNPVSFDMAGNTIVLSTTQEEFASSILHNTGRDTSDGDYTMFVDFSDFDDSSSDIAQCLFEFGGTGGGQGFGLLYNKNNILSLEIRSSTSASTKGKVEYTLTPGQIAAGMLELTAVVDIDYSGTSDLIKLVVDGTVVGIDSFELITNTGVLNDYVNSDKCGFGMNGGNATGGWSTTTFDALPFISGTIDYTAGLTLTEAPSEQPSFNTIALSFAQEEFNTSVLNDTGKDTADAQFSLLADFDNFDDSVSTTPQTVFDIGGGGGAEGLSIVYGPGNELILTICGDWSTRAIASYNFTPEQIIAGMMEVTATVDIDHAGGNGTEDLIQLFVDRISVATATITIPDNDFINGDKSGFGITGGAATGGWQRTEQTAEFTSGKINYGAGLWYCDQVDGIEVSWCNYANLDGLSTVDLNDLASLTYHWFESGIGLEGDIKKDGHIDTLDLQVMASCWLSESAE